MSLQQRLQKLEASRGGKAVCYVAIERDGQHVPATPGRKLADAYAVLPEVCATVEEWAARHCSAHAAIAQPGSAGERHR